jgi:hypothetical protein
VHVAVVIAAVGAVVAGCGLDTRPLDERFDDAPPAATTSVAAATTSTASPSAAPRSAAAGATRPSAPPTVTDAAATALALPAATLGSDGLVVSGNAGPITAPVGPVCGQTVLPSPASGRQIGTTSQSGLSRLVQQVLADDGVVARVRATSCPVTGFPEAPAASGVDSQWAWCEDLGDGREACGVALAADGTAVVLRLDTTSDRAREVTARLATAAAQRLANA